ncbi:MAG: hypothetical protein KAI74_06605 [Kiritimatiellae bacterium]|nr:hypothetical protein [Kiritimatiellia bacterium]
MKTLRNLVLPLMSLAIIFSSLLYIGCEGDDDNVDNYFDDNPYGSSDRESVLPIPDPPASTNEAPAAVALSISPTSVTAVPGQKISFQAAGGTPPYTWTVGQAGHGTVSPSTGIYTVYSHVSAATDINNVIVTDSASAVAIANIN